MVRQMAELARALGRVEEQEFGVLDGLCEAACRQLQERLRKGVKPEDCGQCFVLAGAWLALAGLEVSRSVGQAERFTAGDVSVYSGDAGQRARALRRQAEQIMSSWLRDTSFMFCGVDG
ncbi:MAG: hypothetical protein IJA11_06625 [Oscillospiraceae bacterium]|nr:hypothetical protein [Oscillospiraceae bacterium]